MSPRHKIDSKDDNEEIKRLETSESQDNFAEKFDFDMTKGAAKTLEDYFTGTASLLHNHFGSKVKVEQFEDV